MELAYSREHESADHFAINIPRPSLAAGEAYTDQLLVNL
jgi:hypothetical protein